MMLFRMSKNNIYPYKKEEVSYWTKKWGIDPNELNEAIISTGSLRIKVIKDYLVKKGSITTVSGIMYNLQSHYKSLVAKWNGDEF